MGKKKIRIAWIVHSPTPYKTPFFNLLSEHTELDVMYYFLYWDSLYRPWSQSTFQKFPYKILPALSLPRCLGQNDYIHVGPVVISELKQGHFDIAVICGYNHATLLLSLLWCLVSQTPFVLQGESHLIQKRSKLKKTLKQWLLFPLLRKANAAFATGSKTMEYWEEIGIPRERIFIVSNTPDIHFFINESKKAMGQRELLRRSMGLGSQRTGIFVGRFVKAKGVEVLLEALAQMAPKNRPHMILVGDGPLRNTYDEIIRKAGLPVQIKGFRQKEQLPELYTAADFFVLPSRIEPWGVVVNEAMACGLPVLLSDQVGAAYDLLKEGRNGFMVPTEDVNEWREALEKMMRLSEEELGRMGVESLKIVRPWTHIASVQNVIECVRKICGSPYLVNQVSPTPERGAVHRC